VRRPALLLLLAAIAAGEDADQYFEVGVSYVRKGFFGPARRAFGESLVQAPGQPVPLAFLALASAAEGRPPAEAARALRAAYGNLPEGKALRLDLAALLPSRKALRLLLDDYARRAARARAEALHEILTVAAFLEVHGGRGTASLDRLEREFEGDGYAIRLREAVRPSSAPTTPPSPSAPSAAPAGSRSSRIRS
jgi:hypothetical protein